MDMNGWDTIYAAGIVDANAALAAASGQVLGHLSTTVSGALGTLSIEIVFDAWQIAPGGSGQLLNLMLPVASGSISQSGGSSGGPWDLGGCRPILQVSLQLLPSASDPETQQLLFNLQTAGQVGQQAAHGMVVGIGYAGTIQPPAELADIFLNALAAALVSRSAEISFAFASIGPVPPDSPSWLAPKNCGYFYFETGTPSAGYAGYLALLSTAGDPAGLPLDVDPDLVAGGGTAGFAFSLPLFLEYALLPTLAGTFPDAAPSDFVVTAAPDQITLGDKKVNLGDHKVGLIEYEPYINKLTVTPASGVLDIVASGGCDLHADCSMTFGVTCSNTFTFNQGAQTYGFQADPNPTVSHHTSVPWWYGSGGAAVYGIAEAVAYFVEKILAGSIGSRIAGGLLPSAPPSSVRFAGMGPVQATSVAMNGAIVMQLSQG